MSIEVLTKDDLDLFRIRLLDDIKQLISGNQSNNSKPWLRGTEVRELLSISAGSLQNLRVSGKLKSSKVGGIHYYRYEDIENMMNSKRD